MTHFIKLGSSQVRGKDENMFMMSFHSRPVSTRHGSKAQQCHGPQRSQFILVKNHIIDSLLRLCSNPMHLNFFAYSLVRFFLELGIFIEMKCLTNKFFKCRYSNMYIDFKCIDKIL